MIVMQMQQAIGEEDAVYRHYSWYEQLYYFNLFRILDGPDATPGKESNIPIDDDTYYTQAHLVSCSCVIQLYYQ